MERKKREVTPVVGCSFIAEIKYFAVTICSRSYTCNMRSYLSLVFGLIRESCFVLTCSIKVSIYPDYHCCCCSRMTEETFRCPNMLSLVSFAGSAVLWIGTLTGGLVQGESPPVLVKKSHIQSYSRTSVFGRTYLGVVYRKDRNS